MTEKKENIIPVNDGENKSSGRKLARYAMYYVLAAIVIYYFIMSSISPIRYIRELNSRFAPDSALLASTGEEYLSDSLFIDITGRIAFARARTRMAASDSIGLTVNLPDSVVTIDIKGVAVKRVPLVSYRIAGSLRGVEPYTWTRLQAEPFTVESAVSTIAKQPVMVKIAPRDTAEASAMPDIVPDTTGTGPVFFTLRLGNGFRLTVIQDTGDEDRRDKAALNRFINRRKLEYLMVSARHVASLRFPPYEPEITLRVSKEDARVIYRAIPVNSDVVIRFR